jgi:serine/threonine-protein kinase RsbW
MAVPSHLRLTLASRPENVLVVRQALTGLAGALRLDAIETNDLNTAATEAANNVVMHAYGEPLSLDGGEEGPLEVSARIEHDALQVVVRDHGVGIDKRRRALAEHGLESPGAGMGLAVIDALASESAFTEPPDGGTEVHMEFPLRTAVALEPLTRSSRAAPARSAVARELDPDVTTQPVGVALEVGPRALTQAILPRVLGALAARAHFTTDRISDVQLIAQALAANASDSLDGSQLTLDTSVAPRALELRIGPLRSGRGESLLSAAFDGMAPVVERLADCTRVALGESDSSPEMLELRLVDRR